MTDRAQALETKLLSEELTLAATIERLHTGAISDAAHHAARELTFDAERNSFVRRDTNAPTSVREWLASRREDKVHWFRADDNPQPNRPAARAPVPGAVTNDAPPPAVPGRDRQPSTAPLGRRQVVMSEREWADYSKQNRHAKVVSKSSNRGSPSYVVDVGTSAGSAETSQMSMDEYREWRKSVGLKTGLEALR